MFLANVCNFYLDSTVARGCFSAREIRQGEEVAWYADGDTIVRSEYNPSVAYAYGKLYARNDRLQGFRLIFAAFFFLIVD